MNINTTKGKATKTGLQSTKKAFGNLKTYRESFGFKTNEKGKLVPKLGNAEAKRQWVALASGEKNELNVEGRKIANDNPILAITRNASGTSATLRVALPKAMRTTSGRAPGKVARLENELAQAIARSKAIEDKFNKLLESINLGEAAAA